MLSIENLSIVSKEGHRLLKNVSLTLEKGQVLGLTGASGAGKTTLLKAILGLSADCYQVIEGTVQLNGQGLNDLPSKERRRLCGPIFGYIPQNPMLAFNPRKNIEQQVHETLRYQLGYNVAKSRDVFLRQLDRLNLPDGNRILGCVPKEISGGMLQRIALALVLSLSPEYLLADEPTSALDDDNKNSLIEIFRDIQPSVGLLMISHDHRVLKEICHHILVMAEGSVVEQGSMAKLENKPQTEWTKTFVALHESSGERRFQWKVL